MFLGRGRSHRVDEPVCRRPGVEVGVGLGADDGVGSAVGVGLGVTIGVRLDRGVGVGVGSGDEFEDVSSGGGVGDSSGEAIPSPMGPTHIDPNAMNAAETKQSNDVRFILPPSSFV
jgi:hypothetical protein